MSEIALSKKEIQNRLNTIKIKQEGLNERKYGVSVKYYERQNKDPSKRIDYEIKTSVEISDGVGYIIVDKENIFYNQHEPDLINEIIANAISKSIYPIKTHFNEKGISSNEIVNHDEIIERWNNQKNTILQKYQSTDLDDFFDKADRKIFDKAELENTLKFDWFWNLFFHPKLINYGEKRTVKKDLYLSIVPYQRPIRFSGIQKIEKIPTDYHSFIITFLSDDKKAHRFFYPKNSDDDTTLYMSLNVKFDLDLYYHFPMHTVATLEIYSKEKNTEKVIIKRIQFTMYQLENNQYRGKTLSLDSPFITGGFVKLPPNKWGFDNFENIENNW